MPRLRGLLLTLDEPVRVLRAPHIYERIDEPHGASAEPTLRIAGAEWWLGELHRRDSGHTVTLPLNYRLDLHQDGQRLRLTEHREAEITSTYAERIHVPAQHIPQLIAWLGAALAVLESDRRNTP